MFGARLPLLLLPLPLAAPALSQDEKGQENVLIILSDDMGVDTVGCYAEGPSPANTPTLDALAASGVLFRNVWASPACSPTRAHIQTGRYAFRTGIGMVVRKKGFALNPEERILPEIFDKHPQLGVSHAAFGKWHLGNVTVGGPRSANLAGYDHFVGTAQNLVPPQSFYHWDEIEDGVESSRAGYATSATVDAFLEWQKSVPEPWFAYVAFHAPHDPMHAPPGQLHSLTLPESDPRENPRPFYKAMIEAMDTEIGRMLDGLGKRRQRTNVIFMADNGTPQRTSMAPFLPEHAKLTPYEGGINVPLIISGPAVVAPGREVQALVNSTDLFATALELGGVQKYRKLDSISLLPYLTTPGQPPLRRWAFAELMSPNGFGPYVAEWRMIRDERFKLIRIGPEPYKWEFYDLVLDPFETHDLMANGGAPQLGRLRFVKLRRSLRALLASG